MWKRSAAVLLLCAAGLATSEWTHPDPAVNLTSLLDWKPPKGWHQKFPYYISGFDNGGRPVIVWESGKWYIPQVLGNGSEAEEMAANYIDQVAQVGIQIASAFEKEGGVTVLADFKEFQFLQLTDTTTARLILRFGRYAKPWKMVLFQGLVFNVNESEFFTFVKPVLSVALGSPEVYGNAKDRWLPKVLQVIPKSQLPPWYGGSKDWKPLQVLGKGEPVDLDKLRMEQAKI